MAIDFLNTYQLLQAVKEQPPMSTFLRDRYFPTNDATDIFWLNTKTATEKSRRSCHREEAGLQS